MKRFAWPVILIALLMLAACAALLAKPEELSSELELQVEVLAPERARILLYGGPSGEYVLPTARPGTAAAQGIGGNQQIPY